MFEWARGLLERRCETHDAVGDTTKKVRMEAPNFEVTQFVDWLATIEECFNWYDMIVIGLPYVMCLLEKGRKVYCHLAVSCNSLTKARSQSGYRLGGF